ncbi:MAG: zf-TFIIB domain-containing protein [Planctomycetota bacterium]
MKCPVCRTQRLEAVQYEGVSVRLCDSCDGHLVRNKRIPAIKRKQERSDKQLIEEVNANGDGDAKKKLICPGCLRQMSCRKTSFGPLSFNIEVCDKCDHTWFDAGELARLQLFYQASDQGIELAQFRQRLEQMPDEERDEFEQRVAKMKFNRVLAKEDLIWLCYFGSRFHRR